jgi:type II secretion system protein G
MPRQMAKEIKSSAVAQGFSPAGRRINIVYRYVKEKFFNNDGFTLIELLMVVIILGILAAVAIPQFSSSSTDAKVAALKSNLSSIRGAIELYSVQHGGIYPTAEIEDQMTQYSDADGNYQTTKTGTYKYGPYLKNGFPKNPFVTASADTVVTDETTATIGTVAADPNSAGGWLYVVTTGEFIANHVDYDEL